MWSIWITALGSIDFVFERSEWAIFFSCERRIFCSINWFRAHFRDEKAFIFIRRNVYIYHQGSSNASRIEWLICNTLIWLFVLSYCIFRNCGGLLFISLNIWCVFGLKTCFTSSFFYIVDIMSSVTFGVFIICVLG